MTCYYCSEPMFIDAVAGTSHHGTPDNIDYDTDADHVALDGDQMPSLSSGVSYAAGANDQGY